MTRLTAQHIPEDITDKVRCILEAFSQIDSGQQTPEIFQYAEDIIDDLLTSCPNEAGSYFYAAGLYSRNGQEHKVYQFYKHALTIDSNFEEAWIRLGEHLSSVGNHDAAILAFNRAVKLSPKKSINHILLGQAYQNANQPDKAQEALERGVELKPDQVDGYSLLGKNAQNLGDFELAEKYYNIVLEKNPASADAYFQLTKFKSFRGREGHAIETIKSIVEDPSNHSNSFAHFAIARLYEDQKEYDEAFQFYRDGNDLEKSISPSNRETYKRVITQSIESFSADTFEKLKAAGNSSTKPVFITGMMRSGTTLVEQILASHPDVYAGGEILKMARITDTLISIQDGKYKYPEDINEISPTALAPFGQEYLEFINNLTNLSTKHITDKLPFNFMNIGLIAILFPNAKIVHCARDPIDTCLSCYFEKFKDSYMAELTSDLEHLGYFYKLYEKMMDHWNAVLPGRIYTVRYEELIEDQEQNTKKLLAHVELDWNDSCLKFHENTSNVATASLWQVRQPIYKTSMQRWKNYEKHLKPLIEQLNQSIAI